MDRAVARIHSEYESHARAIADIFEEGVAADIAATAFNNEVFRGADYGGLELVKILNERLAWTEKYLSPLKFSGSISLPAVNTFAGVGDAAQRYTK